VLNLVHHGPVAVVLAGGRSESRAVARPAEITTEASAHGIEAALLIVFSMFCILENHPAFFIHIDRVHVGILQSLGVGASL